MPRRGGKPGGKRRRPKSPKSQAAIAKKRRITSAQQRASRLERGGRPVVVKPGDSFLGIAEREGIDPEKLLAANQGVSQLHPGARINRPSATFVPRHLGGEGPPAPESLATTAPGIHPVRGGKPGGKVRPYGVSNEARIQFAYSMKGAFDMAALGMKPKTVSPEVAANVPSLGYGNAVIMKQLGYVIDPETGLWIQGDPQPPPPAPQMGGRRRRITSSAQRYNRMMKGYESPNNRYQTLQNGVVDAGFLWRANFVR
jgi:hypothetical protein